MEDYPVNTVKQEEISNSKCELYEEFCKLTVYNKLLGDRYQELVEDKQKWQQKREILQDSVTNGKPRRFRRNADQIKRIFQCGHCSKSYGSEASLKNHVKYKHSPYSGQSGNE